MTQPQEEPQVERQEEPQTEEAQYYHSINRYWRGPGSPTKRIHHKSETCRIGGRIKATNRLPGRRDNTEPCPICCKDELPQEQAE